MAQVEEVDINVPEPRRMRFDWLLPVLVRPAKTMRAVMAEERAQWGLPLLLLTLLTLAFVLIAGPLRQQAALNAGVQIPEGFEYMPPDQQEQFMQAQQSGSGPVQTYVFPAIGALAGLWVSWFILGSILHLALTLLGSRSNSGTAYNLAAWASLPFAIRLIVQIVAMLVTKQVITSPGLSGFVPAEAEGVVSYLRVMLTFFDLYLIWQVILLVIGASATPGLTRVKSWSGVLATIVLMLVLAALPGFLGAQLNGLSVDRPFMFF
jgi:hypothetical protein